MLSRTKERLGVGLSSQLSFDIYTLLALVQSAIWFRFFLSGLHYCHREKNAYRSELSLGIDISRYITRYICENPYALCNYPTSPSPPCYRGPKYNNKLRGLLIERHVRFHPAHVVQETCYIFRYAFYLEYKFEWRCKKRTLQRQSLCFIQRINDMLHQLRCLRF